MSNRKYPRYEGREKYRGPPKLCECCGEQARFVVSYQVSWFRGDDAEWLVCEPHAEAARSDLDAFCELVDERYAYMCQTIQAQHEETGRRWTGQRRALPPRYHELAKSEHSNHG